VIDHLYLWCPRGSVLLSLLGALRCSSYARCTERYETRFTGSPIRVGVNGCVMLTTSHNDSHLSYAVFITLYARHVHCKSKCKSKICFYKLNFRKIWSKVFRRHRCSIDHLYSAAANTDDALSYPACVLMDWRI
jgi:hypothetical protein